MVDEPEAGAQPEQNPDSQQSATPVETIAEGAGTATAPSQAAVANAPLEEPLPDWEELTPELFEDECLRGDFMIRWAVILLGVLFGFNYLTESGILTQVKTGHWIAENGFLPPRTDPFAVATEGLGWTNLQWLSDLTIGLVERIGGFGGLTVLTAFKIGLACWILLQLNYPGVSTRWNSMCVALALIALYPVLQPGAMSTTVLGFSALMALLFVWRERPESQALWGLPVLTILWANSDPRAWTGMLLILFFVIVDALRRRLSVQQMQVAGAALVGGILVNPWPLSPLFGFQEMLARAAQAQQEGLAGEMFPRYAYGLMSNEFWVSPDAFAITAVVLLVFAFIALFLNADRFDPALTLSWLVINGLTFLYGELIPYAAVVNCTIASLQGQDWYRNRFTVSYAIDTLNVLRARASQTITVLAITFLAYTAINGMLMGPQNRRIGWGLDPRLQNSIQSTEEELLKGISGERVFNVRPDQGDMLIWLDKKPYLDSRSGLFVRSSGNLAERHRQIRANIFQRGTGFEVDQPVDAVSWQEEFDRLNIQSLILRLWGDQPAYSPFMMLVGTRAWPMTALGAAGAVFVRGDLDTPELREHVEKQNAARFPYQAFSIENSKPTSTESVQIWPRPVSTYDRWLIQKLNVIPNRIQLARHYIEIVARLQQALTLDQAIALGVLATRQASQGILEAPDDPHAYRVLLEAQSLIERAEQGFLELNGVTNQLAYRVQQVVAHAFHAAQASGNDPDDLRRLFVILLGQQNLDTALQIADRFKTRTGRLVTLSEDPEATAEDQQRAAEILQQLAEIVTETRAAVDQARKDGAEPEQLIGIALNGRAPALAIQLIEEDLTRLAQDPGLQLTYASLLLACGQTETAWEQYEGMQGIMDRIGEQNSQLLSQWRTNTALANVIANGRPRAAKLWSDEANSVNEQSLRSLLVQPPATAAVSQTFDAWAAIISRIHAGALLGFPETWASAKFQEALARIDSGELTAAREALQSIYDLAPDFSQRSLVVLYLSLITGKDYELERPQDWIPIWDGMFTPDDEADEREAETQNEKTPDRPPATQSPSTTEATQD